MILSKNELIAMQGGASSVSGTFINSIVKFISTIYELGQSIGSSIRYGRSKLTCSNTR